MGNIVIKGFNALNKLITRGFYGATTPTGTPTTICRIYTREFLAVKPKTRKSQ